jgi:phage terminase large subunit GpA-like protein
MALMSQPPDFPELFDVRFMYKAAAAALRCEPDISVWQWAEQNRELRGPGAAEPGPYRTERTPFLREIQDSLSPSSPYQTVVFMKGSQVGGSEVGNNWLGFCIDHTPGPFLYVLPTVETAKRVSKQRIDPLIDGCPAVKRKVATPRGRSGSNTVQIKEFDGGLLVLTGANSAIGLRQMTARWLMFDEVDAYPSDVGGEGDPIDLAWVRSRTFGSRRKAFIVSSPTIAGASRVEVRFLDSDQRYYHVPCQNAACAKLFVLDFEKQFKWVPKEPISVRVHCPHCDHGHTEADKLAMFDPDHGARWIATAVSADPTVVGYHLSALYSPIGWLSWAEVVRQFENAISEEQKITFANTVLGKPYSQNLAAPDAEVVYQRSRAETYDPDRLPEYVHILTMGVDVHPDRVEGYVWGWGPHAECVLVEHAYLDGDTARPQAWQRLEAYLDKMWTNYAGLQIPLEGMAVDSGNQTELVYRWGAAHKNDPRVMLIKGDPRQSVILGIPARKDVTKSGLMKKYGVKVWPVGVDLGKMWFYKHIGLPFPDPDAENEDDRRFPPGFIHLRPNVSKSTCEQLVSEDLRTTRDKTGRPRRKWIVKPDRRNEALDCWNYAYARAVRWGLWQMSREDWRESAVTLGLTEDYVPLFGAGAERSGGWRPKPQTRSMGDVP